MRDVIVIGAGGGGPVVAKELAAHGLDVLLLEAGPNHDDLDRDVTHYEIDQNNPIYGIFRWGPAERTRPPWFRETSGEMTILQVAGVGGTTLHYFGNCPRAYPGTFAGYQGHDAAAYDAEHRFPFPYRELVPYYEWVEATLPVLTAPMGTKEEVFLRGAATLGIPVNRSRDVSAAGYRPQENCILQPSGTAGRTRDPRQLIYPRAQGCTFCGHCLQGCVEPRGAPRNLTAKRSTDNSYVPMALTADAWAAGGRPVTLMSGVFVIGIETDESGAARGVSCRMVGTGEPFTAEAKVIVMAAGPIEGPRLWLNSGLPNPNGWVGRGLTDHAVDALVAAFPFYTGNSKGPGSNARVDYPGHGALEQFGGTPAFLASSSTSSIAGMSGHYSTGVGGGTGGADGVGRLVGTDLKRFLAEIDRLLVMVILTDDDVQPDCRVRLAAGGHADENGTVPRVEISQQGRTARTRANREFLVGEGVRLLRGAGASRVHRFDFPPTLLHIHSTLRMGADEQDSVLDESGEARWVKRLFVADNAALANSAGGANPTLTTQALATRTAERIFARYFGGRPWVERESPIASTDAAVTRALAAARAATAATAATGAPTAPSGASWGGAPAAARCSSCREAT
jgi:choline dehydrogenase-like flavoprotein